MSTIVSQSIITRRILGCRMFKLPASVLVTDSYHCRNFVEYKVNVAGYDIEVCILPNGMVDSSLKQFGRTICTSQTLAGTVSMMKNCVRWAKEASK